MSKTMSVRMDRDNYDFLHEITKEEGSDLSKAVRDMVTRGRILLAVERYKTGEASLGRAAELAGVPLVQMMTILTEFGVESRLEKEDYLQGLKNLQRSGERGRVRAESAVERRWHKSRRIPARRKGRKTPRRDLTRAFVTLRASSLLPLRTHREFVRYFVP
jgi:predicted HTH domain antitoxin